MCAHAHNCHSCCAHPLYYAHTFLCASPPFSFQPLHSCPQFYLPHFLCTSLRANHHSLSPHVCMLSPHTHLFMSSSCTPFYVFLMHPNSHRSAGSLRANHHSLSPHVCMLSPHTHHFMSSSCTPFYVLVHTFLCLPHASKHPSLCR